MREAADEDLRVDVEDIPDPAVQPAASAERVAHGKPVLPQQRIFLFSADEWEAFIEEWAHFQRSRYVQVKRFAGAGDMGVDVAGFADAHGLKGVWDNYQCKHYADPLQPKTAILEIGKCLWHSFQKKFVPPRRYNFMAPRDCGMSLNRLLLDKKALKDQVIGKWDAWCASGITKKGCIELEGDFLAYVQKFDFGIFISILSKENFGSAFSLFSGILLYPYFVIILSIIVLIIFFRYLDYFKQTKILTYSFIFIVSGIVGNLIDRIIFYM